MNRRDRELLDKQLHAIHVAPRHDGVMIMAILAMFFAGIALGGFFFGSTPARGPIRLASNYAKQIIPQEANGAMARAVH
jgi:hypothetical protein